jgi:exodeoxyribonuclease V alpha subunit
LRRINPQRLAEWISKECAELNDEQRAAVSLLVNSSVAILAGDPGTGKTLTVKSLTAVLERAGYQVYLTAPTGRAAARLAEATGRTAQTLHRLLHNNRRQESLRDLILPQIKEAVIVDEASMLNLFLAERLVEFCSSRTKLIFVGDVYQLPPVGPGQAFRDLIESHQIPIIELTNNHRQSEQSRIAVAARMIKAGIAPELPAPGEVKSDCYFIEADKVNEIQQLVVNTAARSLPRRCGADPHREIQLLTPMRKGALGTIALNNLIRLALNREANAGAQPGSSNHNFQPGDRVLQTRNNYDLGVFNGECGIVVEATEKTVTVSFGGRSVTYQQGSTADLTFGSAITIHRSQGSEYPFVIIPVHESQSVMLTRELLYTAMTRGKRMVVIIGSRRAFAQAIGNPYRHRLTGLPDLLSSAAFDPALRMAA